MGSVPIYLTVLGIGNVLMRDEGIGVAVLERVRDSRSWPAEVEFIDGGAGGLNLLTVIERASRLIVFDAADMGLLAGEFRVITPEQVVADTAGRVSLHDMPFIETLKLCEQFSTCPGEVTIMAIQPAGVDYGRELSEELKKAMPALVAAGRKMVEEAISRT
ncbi:MAG: hydrogenase maturation protease [Phycisphaerae bacterium]